MEKEKTTSFGGLDNIKINNGDISARDKNGKNIKAPIGSLKIVVAAIVTFAVIGISTTLNFIYHLIF